MNRSEIEIAVLQEVKEDIENVLNSVIMQNFHL